MGDQFKLDDSGKCRTCSKLATPGENIQCFSCNGIFHIICPGATADDKVATRTTIGHILSPSTKPNFVFYCDKCLTEIEIERADTEKRRVEILENKMNMIDTQLAEIKELLNEKSNAAKQEVSHVTHDSIWFDKERLAKVKAPEPKAVLVINKCENSQENSENLEIVEKAVMENEIQLSETYENNAGDLVLVCSNQESRDKLKNVVHEANQGITMNSPKAKLKPVTIVGLPKAYKEDEVVDMLLLQNDFIKNFANANKIEDHIKVHVVKPLRNNQNVHQIFASVSSTLREGMQNYRNKVVIGLSSCKIYDRSQTKRCNNCQHYGHFAKECPTPEEPVCGKCSGGHRTDGCDSYIKRCINCVRKNHNESNHEAFDHRCPTMKEHEKQLADRNNSRFLNIQGAGQPAPT